MTPAKMALASAADAGKPAPLARRTVHYYYPYKSDRPDKKYYIITKSEKKIYFGAAGYSDFTKHKDEERRQRYINRHKKKGWLAHVDEYCHVERHRSWTGIKLASPMRR